MDPIEAVTLVDGQQLTPTDIVLVDAPTFEHHREALGIGTSRPRLSWITRQAPTGWKQEWVEVRATTGGHDQTVRLDGDESVLIPWPFAPLRSRERAEVRVRVGGFGRTSRWSRATPVEAGLLVPGDWSAQPVGPGWREDPEGMRRPALLRGTVDVPSAVDSARLYVTAHGLFQMELNGQRVSDDELAPGWTSYEHRLRYVTYNVTELVRPGPNVLGGWLADGWFRGRLGFHGGHVNLYGRDSALLAQLEITHPDGTTTVLGTDSSWLSAPAPIVTSGLLEGEAYDAREEDGGWSTHAFAADGWQPVSVRSIDRSTLVAPDGPPVRCTTEIAPVDVRRTADGRVILDFGQNLVGRLKVIGKGARGSSIRIRHAEVLDRGGELYTRPLRGAHSVDVYTFRGGSEETWEPRFTIHGFRYAEITGWGDNPIEGRVVARVLHTDMRRTGWFETSDSELNRLHENVLWSMRGNFVDLPTDCPQRDERLGWTGDIQVFAPTATYLYDCFGLLNSWLADLSAEQLSDGTVPWYVPTIPGGDQWSPARPGAGWGDAAAIVPWAVYEASGDADVLRRQYDSARAWADLEHRLAGPDGVWDSSYQLGDWLDPSAPPDDPANGETDPHLVATAYYVQTSRRLADFSRRLGRADEDLLRERADRARAAFRERYLTDDVRLTSHSQAAYAMAIMFDLFDVDELGRAGEHLARLVEEAGVHLSTGFLGTPVLLDALSRTGHFDLAMDLLRQRTIPSWLYPVSMGATTIWERWDSMLPDGQVNPGEMTSFNHYAFGAVADWMHREIAGIRSTAAGWRQMEFAPGLRSGLEGACGAVETPYGRAAIEWQGDPHNYRVTVSVPVGVTARLLLPDGERHIGHGEHLVVRGTGA